MEYKSDISASVQLIDPQNRRPFYLYNGKFVDKWDIVDLTEDGCLQVVCENMKL
jgi:hypothetical protein